MEASTTHKRIQHLRRFWLVIALLMMAMAFVLLPLKQQRMARVDSLVQQPVVTGKLEDVYQQARGSSLRIEIQRPIINIFGAKSYSTIGIGSGFFIRADGLVLTAYHVVDIMGQNDDAYRIVGVNAADERYELSLIGFDAYADLALLQADLVGREPEHLPLSYTEPKVGSSILAIGNSNGDFLAPRTGNVMKLDVQARRADFASGTLELSARLAQGDSGGPVLNDQGEVVGVVSYISFIPEDVLEQNRNRLPPFLNNFLERNLNTYASYAVPVSVSNDVVKAILAGGKRDVPVVGIRGDDYNPRTYPALRSSMGDSAGAWVIAVAQDSPAEAAGLRDCQVFKDGRRLARTSCQAELATSGYRLEGDVITHVNGRRIRNFQTMIAAIRSHDIGDVVTLTIQRDGYEKEIALTLGAKADIF